MHTVRSLIDEHARIRPQAPFLFAPEPGTQMSYGQLQVHAREFAARLDALGLAAGDKVAFLLPNGYWTAVIFLAAMYSGRVVVPLNAVAGTETLAYVIEHSDCKLLFADAALREKYARALSARPEHVSLIPTDVDRGPQWPDIDGISGTPALPAVEPDDIAVLIYTSGTTGKPKGVLLSQANAIAGGRNTAGAHALGPEDCALCVLPLYHINGEMVTVMGPLVSAGSVVMPHRFSASSFWPLLARYACSWFSVVPTIIAYLLEDAERQGFDRRMHGGLPRLRFGRSASAPLAPEMHRAFEQRFGVPVVETMGLTETAAQILSNPMPPEPSRYGSPGRAYGNEAKVVDRQGRECPPGVSGELMIRGDNVTRGYYKNDEASRAALEPDGWLHTGDIAYCDEDGFFFITGRLKELIIKGGENIAPREIDEALYDHPAVLEAAGFGVPDDRYGQEVMACVALKPGAACGEQELRQLTENRLGTYKAPKRIFFMEALPKGPSGKIQRLKLPELIRDRLQDPE